MTLLRRVLLLFAHFSIRELLEKDVGQVAGGLVQHCIHCAVHVSEYLTPNTTLEEVQVVVQVILQMLLNVICSQDWQGHLLLETQHRCSLVHKF